MFIVCLNLTLKDPAGSRANLEGVNLKGAVLEGSIMAGINLRVATLKNVNMQNCDLRMAVLVSVGLYKNSLLLSIQPTSLLEMQLIATDRHKTNNYQTLEHNHFPRGACFNHSDCIVG